MSMYPTTLATRPPYPSPLRPLNCPSPTHSHQARDADLRREEDQYGHAQYAHELEVDDEYDNGNRTRGSYRDTDNNMYLDDGHNYDDVDMIEEIDAMGAVASPETFLFHSTAAVQRSVTTDQRSTFTNFIHNEQQQQLNKYYAANERPPQSLSDYSITNTASTSIVRHPDHHKLRYSINKQYRQKCGPQQQEALRRIVHLMRVDVDEAPDQQMLFFLSGEGGTGKSMLIDILRNAAKVIFGLKGPLEPMLCLAPTGSAAFNIDGFTWHNALALTYNSDGTPNQASAELLGAKLKGTEVICIDENSLLGQLSLKEISNRLQYARAAQLVGTNLADRARRDRLALLPFGGFKMLWGTFTNYLNILMITNCMTCPVSLLNSRHPNRSHN